MRKWTYRELLISAQQAAQEMTSILDDMPKDCDFLQKFPSLKDGMWQVDLYIDDYFADHPEEDEQIGGDD